MLKKILMVLAIAGSLFGCAGNQAAICKNAQFAYSTSVAMLDKELTEEANKYWAAYKIGADLAIQTYCVK